MCAGAIINARIGRVVFGTADPKAGSCGSLVDLFALPYNHRPQLCSGVLADECRDQLTGFFRQLRARPRPAQAGPDETTQGGENDECSAHPDPVR